MMDVKVHHQSFRIIGNTANLAGVVIPFSNSPLEEDPYLIMIHVYGLGGSLQ